MTVYFIVHYLGPLRNKVGGGGKSYKISIKMNIVGSGDVPNEKTKVNDEIYISI